MLLRGKTAVISGAASPRGIGFATARRFAAEGARVAILRLEGHDLCRGTMPTPASAAAHFVARRICRDPLERSGKLPRCLKTT